MRLQSTLVTYHLLVQIVRFLSHFTVQKEPLQRLSLTKEKTGTCIESQTYDIFSLFPVLFIIHIQYLTTDYV